MDISAEIAAIQAASQGSELRQPLVGALNKLNSGSLPAVTTSDAGKILKVGANGWEVGEKSGYMPVPTDTMQITDNGAYDVTNYASANVQISGGGSAVLVTKTITQNGTYDPADDNADGYSSVVVNVSDLVNDNLLCNWDFSNVVNTRGNSSYTYGNTSGFTIDGWKLWRGTVNVVTGGIKLVQSYLDDYTTFLQFWPTSAWVTAALDKTFTISLLTEKELIYDTFVLSSATGDKSTNAKTIDNKIMFSVYRDSSTQVTFNIRFLDGPLNSVSDLIIAAKIEIGNKQTLAQKVGNDWILLANGNQDTEYIKVRTMAQN